MTDEVTVVHAYQRVHHFNDERGSIHVDDTDNGLRLLSTSMTRLPLKIDLSWDDLAALAKGEWKPNPFVQFLKDLEKKLYPMRDIKVTPVDFLTPVPDPEPEPPHWICQACGKDYGIELPYPDLNPVCGNDEIPAGDDCDGLVRLEGNDFQMVWMVTYVDPDRGFVGSKFFHEDDAYAHADQFEVACVHKVAFVDVKTEADLNQSVKEWIAAWINDAATLKINRPTGTED